MSGNEVLRHVHSMLQAVRSLEELYPGRSFTLDGHLVGSIGEVLAAELYELKLLGSSTACHDAVCPSGRNVQIKLTQRQRIAMYDEPDHLIVLRIGEDTKVKEVYNGPGAIAWSSSSPKQKNGQRSVSVAKLTALNRTVPRSARIPAAMLPDWFMRETYR